MPGFVRDQHHLPNARAIASAQSQQRPQCQPPTLGRSSGAQSTRKIWSSVTIPAHATRGAFSRSLIAPSCALGRPHWQSPITLQLRSKVPLVLPSRNRTARTMAILSRQESIDAGGSSISLMAISLPSYASACTIASAPPAESLSAVMQQLSDCLLLVDCAVLSIGTG